MVTVRGPSLLHQQPEPEQAPCLYFAETELPAIPTPAKPLLKPSTLEENCFILPGNKIFIDKVLPTLTTPLIMHEEYSTEYFVALYKLVSAPTLSYPSSTPNYLGARIIL